MSGGNQISLGPVSLTRGELFGASGSRAAEEFLSITDWAAPIRYFVGRNGTGKSRAATEIARRTGGRHLSTDRLVGLMSFSSYGWTSVPNPEQQRGVPLGEREREQARQFATTAGTGVDELYAIREQPGVWLRVAAFIRRALGRVVELREQSGFLDPHIRIGETQYSLLREEGHGLRELVILLAASYRQDWTLLVVDEPELHLHPALARLWLAELEADCQATGKRALVVTHEPSLLRPKLAHDLEAVWLFVPDLPARTIGSAVIEAQSSRVDSSLQQNPELVAALAFSPRPVLVEGKHDVAALTAALTRTKPPEAVAQTDLVECGGTGGVALWFEIASKLGVDVRAVADLDAIFDRSVQRVIDQSHGFNRQLREELKVEPPTAANALRPLQERMAREAVAANPRAKTEWLATLEGDGDAARRDALLKILRQVGFWLHPQGRLEHVLSIDDKGVEQARIAASIAGPIDVVADWCAYALDPAGEVKLLLDVAVERIAHNVMEALRIDPATSLNSPVGSASESDARLVDVANCGPGRHRITVKTPASFAGWWLEFSRDTPASQLELQPPS